MPTTQTNSLQSSPKLAMPQTLTMQPKYSDSFRPTRWMNSTDNNASDMRSVRSLGTAAFVLLVAACGQDRPGAPAPKEPGTPVAPMPTSAPAEPRPAQAQE